MHPFVCQYERSSVQMSARRIIQAEKKRVLSHNLSCACLSCDTDVLRDGPDKDAYALFSLK